MSFSCHFYVCMWNIIEGVRNNIYFLLLQLLGKTLTPLTPAPQPWFQLDWKSRFLQLFDIATLLLKHASFLQLGLFYLQPRRTYYLAITTTMPLVNLCALQQLVGHTSHRLQEHIKQHVSKPIRNHHSCPDCSNLSCACKTNSSSQIIAMTPLLDSIF